MAECQRCGVQIPPHPGKGRPRKWCSDRCKRGVTSTQAEINAKAAARFPLGRRFTRLMVERYVNSGLIYVRCECGVHTEATAHDLENNLVKSCGCLRRENMARTGIQFGGSNRVHGMAGTPEYAAWVNIRRRIFNPDCDAYPNYGGRGLTMDPDWIDDFEAFYAEVGPRPAHHLSIDRIDNDLGYVKGNLRWATPAQQTANRRAA